jgi:uncharacterized protein (TIGR02246 family)
MPRRTRGIQSRLIKTLPRANLAGEVHCGGIWAMFGGSNRGFWAYCYGSSLVRMNPQTEDIMKTSKVIAASSLLLTAGLLIWTTGTFAQQPKPEQPAKAHQLLEADEKAIQEIMKDQETAWNKHDMKAFTKSFRDDVDGINIVGMYWRGKAVILKHLTDFHKTNFKDLEETLEEVNVHSIGDGYAIAIVIWKVGAFKAPSGVEIPACRHRSTLVLAKGADGWKVVHFHNTTIDEEAVKGAAGQLKK